MTELQKIQDLYDRNLFLQAYLQSAAYWSPSTSIKCLSTDELILGARLAARLGGLRLSRRLFHEARIQDPSNPRVKYFTGYMGRRGSRLIDDLRAFEDNPDLGGDDTELRAAWFASYAVLWASLRDFARAGDCIEHAHSLVQCDSWVLSCESAVLDLADRWQDALKSAERAWEINRGAPYVVSSLTNRLARLTRVAEAAERAAIAARESESYEITGTACFHLCALAETLSGAPRLGLSNALAILRAGLRP